MSDIFREIDEEVRREQFLKLWERYGTWMIAACVLVVLAVAGWRLYEWQQNEKAAEAGAKFEAAATLANEGKTKEAEEAFAKIAADGTANYRMLAKFREAGEQARQDTKAAVAVYDQLAADGNIGRVFQDLAALRAGTLLVDTASYADLKSRLEPLTAPDRAFRHSARVMLALSAWHAKDTAAMRQWSDMILADAETPAGARGQAQMLLALADSDKKS
ncbi:MAG: tetratricopeptide repeat protein [Rhizobiales bacterium]|nr:tetratricopeptide repeat protein [Hyphomicrobiales bacterium]